jgi:crystallin alpha B
MSLWIDYNIPTVMEFIDPFDFEYEPIESYMSPFGLPRSLLRQKRVHKISRSEVVSDKDHFQVTLHVPDFNSNEISVKLVDRTLVVVAEHEEKPDEAGHVYRHIRRRYILPRNADFDKIESSLSDDGILTITAPKKALQSGTERNIPIEQLPSSEISQTPKQEMQLLPKPEEKVVPSQKQQQQPQPQPQQQQQQQQQQKGNVDIPVSHEGAAKKGPEANIKAK